MAVPPLLLRFPLHSSSHARLPQAGKASRLLSHFSGPHPGLAPSPFEASSLWPGPRPSPALSWPWPAVALGLCVVLNVRPCRALALLLLPLFISASQQMMLWWKAPSPQLRSRTPKSPEHCSSNRTASVLGASHSQPGHARVSCGPGGPGVPATVQRPSSAWRLSRVVHKGPVCSPSNTC